MELKVVNTAEELDAAHTPCRNCALAEWAGTTQSGCRLGRVEAYRRVGTDVVDAEDDERRFFVINGRVCNAYRDASSGWAEGKADLARAARDECAIRIAAVVLVEQEAGLETTLEALLAQTLRPRELFVVRNHPELKSARLLALLRRVVGAAVPWRMVSVVEPPCESGRAVDMAVVQSKKSNWYAVFRAGYAPHPSLFADVDAALNDRMERFAALAPLPSGDALMAQLALHRHPLVQGHRHARSADGEPLNDVVAKLRNLAWVDESPWLVRPATDFIEE